MELFDDLGTRPMVLIRFNPDGFIDKTGKKIQSCFKYHETLDIPIIRDKDVWEIRIKVLLETIQYHLDNVPEKELTIIKLYFDEI